ncbi:helix-turn-helix transcriptional regulator [Rathayibacter sp. ZW T2_19]|uniref:Helix-turn-helix transcriptional regulator n=1 Tax=Rathayibacter rubneri TaxID=2950106 RepID=A0A9X2E258_9MICO|nr:helix-turn-helix transcriptional regulator [Rathayibacter rubneri]MCM6764133.1 helix-turn-helix transcriptional regulator [Rathayibacter rubneri]
MPAVAECRALLAGIPFGVDAGVDAARAELHYQWARALEDVGATREACREYESAARLADLTPRPGRMRSLAGGAAAFLSALHGHRGQAERILREFCDGGAEPLGGGVSAALARAQLSFDELDRDTARRIMSEIDVVSVEHRWAHYLRTLALVEWEQQRPHRLAAELDSRLRALSSRALTGMTADAVRITEYLRAAAAGRRDLAHAALGSATATGTVLEQLVTALRALDFTRIGRSEDARRLVASLRAASLVPRTELLTLVAAPERSDADLARITDLAVEYRLYWLLSALPENEHRAVTARIAEREGTVVPVERREPALAVCASALSERERDVAERAALRERTSDIAAALFVSANTVKTQLRSIYRKLDVSTRDELYDALKGLAREVSLTE